ncbi:MAG: serine hydrolase [Acidobacteria bacterium]|nr:serine hydrolase [Acidobacteriota bacterium]
MISSCLRAFESLRFSFLDKPKGSKARRVLAIATVFLFASFSAFPESPQENWADKTLKNLSLRDRIAQLVQIRVSGKFLNRRSAEFDAIRDQIKQNHVGGVVLFAGNVYESAILLNDLQSISRLPLLVAADFERGASFRIADTTSFAWTMALGATNSEQFAYQQGLATARESRALGVHWIFAPVLDVNNNPRNPVINIRSFGEDPDLVSRLGSAFIRGARSGGVLTTAKHFPGHGDTATDSHLRLAVVQSDMARLQSVELAPFKSAIEAGVDSIMTAHVSVPKVTGEPQTPATLSSKILNDLLRNSLNFKGLVVTDALEMGGITNTYWCGLAAVRAIQAGSDILLLPADPTVAINEVVRAVKRGDIPESRINESVRKVLRAKSRLKLHQTRMIPISGIGEIIASPQNLELAQNIADHSITVLKDQAKLLPIDPTGYPKILSLVLTPDLESEPGAVFQAEMRRRFPFIETLWGNARISDEFVSVIEKAVSESDLIVFSTLGRLVSGRNSEAMPAIQRKIFDKLMASRKPLIWMSFGNPYIVQSATQVGTYACAFSYSDVSQIAAAKALAGEIEITGRMPVSIPGYSKAGDGLAIPKLDMVLKSIAATESGPLKSGIEKAGQLLETHVQAGTFPGAQLVVGYKGRIILNFAIGRIAPSGVARMTSPETVYDLASLSAVVGLSSAVMMAAESKSLILDAPVLDYVPEMKEKDIGKLNLSDLWKASANKESSPVSAAAGNRNLLMTIVNRATATPLERLLTERLFKPLGMSSTFYKPPQNYRGEIAYSGESTGERLFCSAQDLALFAQMLLNRGIYAHRRYLRPETVDRISGRHSPWFKPSDSDWAGKLFSPGAFGHNGETGSMLWIDPSRKLFIVLLANGRPDNGRISEAQRNICESILSSIPE